MEKNSLKSERLTMQKKEILEFLRNTKIHPSSEQVYEAVKEKMPMISLATVYRNLNQMADNGIIEKISDESVKEMRFDGNPEKHQHFICEKCNKIIDIEIPNESKIIPKIKNRKFSVKKIRINLIGTCTDCSEKSD